MNSDFLPSGKEKRKYCIFTSAGDKNGIEKFLFSQQERNWDLIVAFYGNSAEKYRDISALSDLSFIMKGSKFQNLKKIFSSQPDIFSGYDYIWVIDDDLEFVHGNANVLFNIAATFDFSVSQPAFSMDGKISHDITKVVEKEKLLVRIVNFIEVTCPLFRGQDLIDFLNIYDGEMAGWGIDWRFCHYLGSNRKAKFAIFDKIVVRNPHDAEKNGREISSYMSDFDRRSQWEASQRNLRCQEFAHQVFFEIFTP